MKKYTPKPNILFYYKSFASIINCSIALWIIETIYFLYRDGWHWEAINPDEKMWDSIVGLGINVAMIFFFMCAIVIIKSHVFHIRNEWEKENGIGEDNDEFTGV